jgi:hypothetical protein
MSSLVGYEPYVNECTALFKSRLGEIAAAGKDADMGRWFQLYAFDVIEQITVCIAGDGLLGPTGRTSIISVWGTILTHAT